MASARDELLQDISDLTKDVYGFRDRSERYLSLSVEELKKEVDFLVARLEEHVQEEAREQAEALIAYEARIQTYMTDYKLSQADAIRWDMQAEDLDVEDIEHYLWRQGLSFKDMKKFMDVLKVPCLFYN